MPTATWKNWQNKFKIIYKCKKCSEIHKNIIANDDDFNKIIDLSVAKKEF